MKIKPLFILIILMAVIGGSSSISAQTVSQNSNSAAVKKSDIVYITDHKSFEVTFKGEQFYKWLKKQSPKHKYLQSSLEIENMQYADEWNRRVGNPKYNSNMYVQQVDYQIKPKLHYGMDVNYELFMYFKFFEEKYEKLLIRG